MNTRWIRTAGLAVSLVAATILALALLASLARAERNAAPEAVTAPTLVSFQGRVTANGTAYNGVGYFKFAVVNAAGNTSYWSNDSTSTSGGEPNATVPLSVANGLFTVLLGDTAQSGMSSPLGASVFGAPDRRLRVWFSTTGLTGSFEQLTPDYAIGAAPFALNAETLDGLDSSAFAANIHAHSGADIVSGTLPDARLSGNVVMSGQAVSQLSNDAGYLTTASAGAAGYITQTLADARYARNSPTTQQIALLKWYTTITGTGSTFGVGSSPQALAFDGANIWVTNNSSNTVSVLRASDGYHVMTPTVGSSPQALAFDGANMWVANSGSHTINVLRASDGSHVMTPTAGLVPFALAFDGANVWVANLGSDTVSVLRASDGYHVITPTAGSSPCALAFDGANMWVVNNGGNSVSVLRASDGYHVMTPTIGSHPRALAFDGANMWVGDYGGGAVNVLRASDGYRVMTPTVGSFPTALAFDGANMWVANSGSGTVSVLRASDGYHVMTPTVGSLPVGIAFDGAFMWVANNGSDTVSKR